MEKHKHEKPLICTADSVNAILARLKRQTRRVVVPQPPADIPYEHIGWLTETTRPKKDIGKVLFYYHGRGYHHMRCPYATYGEESYLWVREPWFVCGSYDELSPVEFPHETHVWYPASTWTDGANDPDLIKTFHGKRRSSIHMPRWASRLDLLVKNIEVEQVQDMTRLDIVEEGFLYFYRKMTAFEKSRFADDIEDQIVMAKALDSDDFIDDAVIEWYADWWDALNAKRGYSWDSNPWVWKITFDPVD